MLAEENIANKWIDRLNLKHPVDIRLILSGFAEIIEDNIPFNIDAILTQRRAVNSKPKVILQRAISSNRITFTLAHELGHLLIPWHVGNFACSLSAADSSSQIADDVTAFFARQECEYEANRFAAEILMPTTVMEKLLSLKRIEKITEYAKNGNISAEAISIKLKKTALPGNIFLITKENKVEFSCRSKDTYLDEPQKNTSIDLELYSSMGADIQEDIFPSGRKLTWINLVGAKKEPPRINDSGNDWRTVFNKILDDLGYREPQRKLKIQSISGVIGVAAGKAKYYKLDLYTTILARFIQNRNHSDMTHHEMFHEFINKRVMDIKQRNLVEKNSNI